MNRLEVKKTCDLQKCMEECVFIMSIVVLKKVAKCYKLFDHKVVPQLDPDKSHQN